MNELELWARFADIESSLCEAMPPDRLSLLKRTAKLNPSRSGRGFTNLGVEVVGALTEAAVIPDEDARRDFLVR